MSHDKRRSTELARLLRHSARLRKRTDELGAEAGRLRAEIAKSTKGRSVERRTKPRTRGK